MNLKDLKDMESKVNVVIGLISALMGGNYGSKEFLMSAKRNMAELARIAGAMTNG